jgi:hypothetical protein
MPKPRVALIFSGQPRCIDGISYQSFQKCILDRYDVDVYAHFWEDVESSKTTGNVAANIETFKKLYSPRAIQVDRPLTADEYPMSFIQPHSPVPLTRETLLDINSSNWAYWVRNCISMYESMKRAYTMFESSGGGSYDWIIRTRTDCVLLRCPSLESLDPKYLYAPNWHGHRHPVIVNHALITPPDIASTLFRIRDTVCGLRGTEDESFVYNHLQHHRFLDRVRTLPMTTFYPTLTRDGIQTDKPEPTLRSEIVNPPYVITHAPTRP